MLGGTQKDVHHGDQGNMSLNSLETPQLILSDQAGGDMEGGLVRQLRLAMVDDQALFAEVVNAMRGAVAVILLLLTLVTNDDRLEHRLTVMLQGVQVLLFQPPGKLVQAFPLFKTACCSPDRVPT